MYSMINRQRILKEFRTLIPDKIYPPAPYFSFRSNNESSGVINNQKLHLQSPKKQLVYIF